MLRDSGSNLFFALGACDGCSIHPLSISESSSVGRAIHENVNHVRDFYSNLFQGKEFVGSSNLPSPVMAMWRNWQTLRAMKNQVMQSDYDGNLILSRM